ncbi:regulatory protein RecX [Rheinheimera sp.]|uniref:regulatory protein RecX n=1 Tax=Rheinheimera sp. TaxID=1869214 RepID=UPI00307D481D
MAEPQPSQEPKPLTEQELRQWLLALLSRREYSALELKQKLKQKGASAEQTADLLDWVQQRNYQSELRYARQLIQAKLHKGYGWFYINQLCAEQGLEKSLVQAVLDELNVDWLSIASEAYQKKYADKPIVDYQDKQKRMRYLQSRGFDGQVIQQLFKQL